MAHLRRIRLAELPLINGQPATKKDLIQIPPGYMVVGEYPNGDLICDVPGMPDDPRVIGTLLRADRWYKQALQDRWARIEQAGWPGINPAVRHEWL